MMEESCLGETDLGSFIEALFSRPPLPPFQLRVPELKQEHLIVFLTIGATKLFNDKKLHTLTEEEQKLLNSYLNSIGFSYQCKPVELSKEVTDYHPDGRPFKRTVTLTQWQFTFATADVRLHPHYGTNTEKIVLE